MDERVVTDEQLQTPTTIGERRCGCLCLLEQLKQIRLAFDEQVIGQRQIGSVGEFVKELVFVRQRRRENQSVMGTFE